MRPKLSVVIPMYNEERYLKRCLDSLLKQTQKIYEIILIDDGSTDDTIKIAKQYKKKCRFIILKQEHKGPGAARNYGASKAHGKILILIDADMLFDENYLKHLIKPIINDNEFGTTHGTEKVANLNNLWARSWSINRLPNPPLRTAVFRAIVKDVFLEKGGFKLDNGYFDDDLSHIGSGAVIKEAICYHNNPETLKEAFKHSVWVGRGIYKTSTLGYYLNRTRAPFVLFIAMTAFLIVFVKPNGLDLLAGAFGVITGMISFFVIKQAVKEKYLSHLVCLPIMWFVRLCGYGVGFLKEKFTNQ